MKYKVCPLQCSCSHRAHVCVDGVHISSLSSIVLRVNRTMRIFRRLSDQCPSCWKCQSSLFINLLPPNKTKSFVRYWTVHRRFDE